MSNSVWQITYDSSKGQYAVSRYMEPNKIVAYTNNYFKSIQDLYKKYGEEINMIFIKKADGTVDFWSTLIQEIQQ